MWLFATDRVVRSIADAHAAIVESVATSAGFVRPEADLSETDAYLLAEKECIRRGRAPVLCRAVVWKESRGKQLAVSPKGALGLMQVMPANAKRCGLTEPGELLKKHKNVPCGVQILDEDIRFHREDIVKGLQSYNGGPNCVAVISRCGSNTDCMAGCKESYLFARDVITHAMNDLS